MRAIQCNERENLEDSFSRSFFLEVLEGLEGLEELEKLKGLEGLIVDP